MEHDKSAPSWIKVLFILSNLKKPVGECPHNVILTRAFVILSLTKDLSLAQPGHRLARCFAGLSMTTKFERGLNVSRPSFHPFDRTCAGLTGIVLPLRNDPPHCHPELCEGSEPSSTGPSFNTTTYEMSQAAERSIHLGLSVLINSSFLARAQPLTCFSRVSAA